MTLHIHLVLDLGGGKWFVSSHNSEEDASREGQRKEGTYEDGWTFTEESELKDLSSEQLLSLYNWLKPGQPVKKFKNEKEGRKLVWDLLNNRKPDEKKEEPEEEEDESLKNERGKKKAKKEEPEEDEEEEENEENEEESGSEEEDSEEEDEEDQPEEDEEEEMTEKAKNSKQSGKKEKPAKGGEKEATGKKAAKNDKSEKKETKAEKPAKKEKGKRGGLDPSTKLVVKAKENPRRKGTIRWKQFERYKNCKTVGEAVKAGVPEKALRRDKRKGIVDFG